MASTIQVRIKSLVAMAVDEGFKFKGLPHKCNSGCSENIFLEDSGCRYNDRVINSKEKAITMH
jgi:hypothetical protein